MRKEPQIMISTPGLSSYFLKKENYAGSHSGMRFYFQKSDDILLVSLYEEPWCLEETPPDRRIVKEFPFTEEGVEEGIAWTNSLFESQRERWLLANKEKMMRLLQA